LSGSTSIEFVVFGQRLSSGVLDAVDVPKHRAAIVWLMKP